MCSADKYYARNMATGCTRVDPPPAAMCATVFRASSVTLSGIRSSHMHTMRARMSCMKCVYASRKLAEGTAHGLVAAQHERDKFRRQSEVEVDCIRRLEQTVKTGMRVHKNIEITAEFISTKNLKSLLMFLCNGAWVIPVLNQCAYHLLPC